MLTTDRKQLQRNGDYKPTEVKSVFPKRRQDVLNLNGWGFADSVFDTKNGQLYFTGNRYPAICNIPFLKARSHILKILDADVADYVPFDHPVHKPTDYAPPVENPKFCKELKNAKVDYSLDFDDRFFRCRGQSCADFYVLRFRKFRRIPDIVVWPKCHKDVEVIVKLANEHLAVIIPFGGGTNITQALSYTKKDNGRFFISLDTSQMNRILWVDRISMLACIESGIAGKDMEDALGEKGLTMGHEPDSLEFSTLGGWIATRSSGMKQQTYGNIEQMVSRTTIVTSIGTMEKNYQAPRAAIGPDFDQGVVLGSEGTLGVITNVIVKVHPKPPIRRCGSILFPDFESGTNFMYEVSKFRTKPSSLRLVDNVHFQIAQALNQNNSLFGRIYDHCLKVGAAYLFGYNFRKVALATYLIEGEQTDVDPIDTKLKEAATKYGGINAGTKYGERGYLMTFTICYIRDFFLDLGLLAESLEPSVSWTKVWSLLQSIDHTWNEEMRKRKIKVNIMAYRISQVYNDGVCIYLYYGVGRTTGKDQLETFEELTGVLKHAIKVAGGSLSHHHGIGKKSSKGYREAVSGVGVEMFHSIKSKLDPNNIFDVGNLTEDKNGVKV